MIQAKNDFVEERRVQESTRASTGPCVRKVIMNHQRVRRHWFI